MWQRHRTNGGGRYVNITGGDAAHSFLMEGTIGVGENVHREGETPYILGGGSTLLKEIA